MCSHEYLCYGVGHIDKIVADLWKITENLLGTFPEGTN
jgi:hypothetical protein